MAAAKIDEKTYRTQLVKDYHRITNEFRAKKRIILDTEAHQPTIEKRMAIIKKTADQEMDKLVRELTETVHYAEVEAVASVHRARRAGSDAKREGYVQINAQNAFDGLTDDQIVEKYPDYIKNMHPDDKPFQYAVDDIVRAKVRGDAGNEMLKYVITQHMQVNEKIAQVGVQRSQALRDTHNTVTGLIKSSIAEIARGAEKESMDVASMFDSLFDGHGRYKSKAVKEFADMTPDQMVEKTRNYENPIENQE